MDPVELNARVSSSNSDFLILGETQPAAACRIPRELKIWWRVGKPCRASGVGRGGLASCPVAADEHSLQASVHCVWIAANIPKQPSQWQCCTSMHVHTCDDATANAAGTAAGAQRRAIATNTLFLPKKFFLKNSTVPVPTCRLKLLNLE